MGAALQRTECAGEYKLDVQAVRVHLFPQSPQLLGRRRRILFDAVRQQQLEAGVLQHLLHGEPRLGGKPLRALPGR